MKLHKRSVMILSVAISLKGVKIKVRVEKEKRGVNKHLPSNHPLLVRMRRLLLLLKLLRKFAQYWALQSLHHFLLLTQIVQGVRRGVVATKQTRQGLHVKPRWKALPSSLEATHQLC
uniref:Uncharacterized protein n=1 Tax=Cacopsylla melanoneura TaxID=428564 RepID=A0A8D8UCJ8_9HEMI